MKLILAQPSIPRFQWELEVLLTNLQSLGKYDIVLLFSKPSDYDDTVPHYLANKYGVQCFIYNDNRFDKRYTPSIRPYLWWQHLAQHPELENETYFYIDADIIFREMVNFKGLVTDSKHWIGSDCDHYIGLDYILGCENGQLIAENMAQICGITVDQMRGVPGIGAQLLITNPNAGFWERAYDDSQELAKYLELVPSNIQKWTAEMWAQLWGMVREDIDLSISKELDFCRPTDDISEFAKVKILHNAGVVDNSTLFYKGAYATKMPFGEDFSYVDPTKASIKYVQALEKVVH